MAAPRRRLRPLVALAMGTTAVGCAWSSTRTWVTFTDATSTILHSASAVRGSTFSAATSVLPLLCVAVIAAISIGGFLWVRATATLVVVTAAAGVGQAVAALAGRAHAPGIGGTGVNHASVHVHTVAIATALVAQLLAAAVGLIAAVSARTVNRLSRRYERTSAQESSHATEGTNAKIDSDADALRMWAELDRGNDPTAAGS